MFRLQRICNKFCFKRALYVAEQYKNQAKTTCFMHRKKTIIV
ncbi:hypothetical protein PIN17_A0157 [Prevotella intermedia 17]|nr:hypothetical protein PIN17_A0157 [Prevotella intermedia 17]